MIVSRITSLVVFALVSQLARLASAGSSGSSVAAPITIAIGWNGTPNSLNGGLAPLNFADDDAIAVYGFGAQFGDSYLLTAVDGETQRRTPGSVPSQPPTLVGLRRLVGAVAETLKTRKGGDSLANVTFFYSGHGVVDENGVASLTFADGQLGQNELYDEILAPLDGLATVHVFVDACHAEGVVRPRDASATTVATPDEHAHALLASQTLARFANVGAAIATTTSAQSHEWDAYQSGIFTHELLSALRGAADVNGDGLVEYSELAAFLSSANRQVRDPRARLRPIVTPPRANPRAAIVTLASLEKNAGRLRGNMQIPGPFSIEDADGNRLVDFNPEPNHKVNLRLPPDNQLYVRSTTGEAPLRLAKGGTATTSALVFGARNTRARGSLADSLERGLFASEFGPRYYLGFMDKWEQAPAVDVSPPQVQAEADVSSAQHPTSRPYAIGAFSLAGLSGIAAATFSILAYEAHADVSNTQTERYATEAASRYQRDGILAWSSLGLALVSAGLGTYLW